MKKSKLLFKVDHNNRGKIYIGNKWLKDVRKVDIHGEPWDYTVTIVKYKRNAEGKLWVMNNEIAQETKTYRVCRRQK